jgi:hypothetical protein
VGDGHRPKSTLGGDPGAGSGPRGLDAIAEFGRGQLDPETGIFEWYDIPPGHPARRRVKDDDDSQAGSLSFLTIVEQWDLLVADFRSEYGIGLALGERIAWREFRPLVAGLLACDSRIARHFQPPPEPLI